MQHYFKIILTQLGDSSVSEVPGTQKDMSSIPWTHVTTRGTMAHALSTSTAGSRAGRLQKLTGLPALAKQQSPSQWETCLQEQDRDGRDGAEGIKYKLYKHLEPHQHVHREPGTGVCNSVTVVGRDRGSAASGHSLSWRGQHQTTTQWALGSGTNVSQKIRSIVESTSLNLWLSHVYMHAHAYTYTPLCMCPYIYAYVHTTHIHVQKRKREVPEINLVLPRIGQRWMLKLLIWWCF